MCTGFFRKSFSVYRNYSYSNNAFELDTVPNIHSSQPIAVEVRIIYLHIFLQSYHYNILLHKFYKYFNLLQLKIWACQLVASVLRGSMIYLLCEIYICEKST